MCITTNRIDIAISLTLAFIVIMMGMLVLVPETCGVYHDDAIYLSTAKAIAEGDGYRLINLPGSPAQTKYPPLYPTILAIAWKLQPSFPQNIFLFKFITLLSASITIATIYIYLVHFNYFSRLISFSSCLLCSTLPLFLYFSTNIMSEMPFSLLTIVMLWTVEKSITLAPQSRKRYILQGMLLALPFLCRTIGAIYIPIGLVKLYKSRRNINFSAIGVLIICIPLLLWMLLGSVVWKHDSVTGYYTDYIGWWSEGVKSFAQLIGYNILMVLSATGSITLTGLLSAIKSIKSFNSSIFILLLTPIPWLFVIKQFRQGRVLPAIMIGYLAVILFWPWPPGRFLIIFAPYLISYFFYGLTKLFGQYIQTKLAKVGVTVLFIFLMMQNIKTLIDLHHVANKYNYPYSSLPDTHVSWSSYQELFHWLTTNTHPDNVIASGIDSMLYIYTSRKAFRPFKLNVSSLFYGQYGPQIGTVEEFISNINTYNAKYLVFTPMPYFAEEKPFKALIDLAISKHPNLFKKVYTGNDARFIIYELQTAL